MPAQLHGTADTYFDGQWHIGEGSPLSVHNPADGTEIAVLAQSSDNQVRGAVDSAHRAQAVWARVPIVERGARIRHIADVIATNRTMLADLITDEMGKRTSEASDELDFAESFMRYNAEWDRRLEGELLAGDGVRSQIHLRREPLGVIAAICPWNFPLAVLCRKLGPALLTGNTVVIKPSEVSPLSSIALVRLISELVDLPPGVINLVIGDGSVGRALVTDPMTSMVTFTGHRDTGKAVMAAAATNLTRVSLELGGKAPAIVWRDADLDLAVSAIAAARHTNCGQVCTSAERVLVHRSIIDDFSERYAAAVETMTVGDPRSGASLGPMASQAQVTKTRQALDAALGDGASVVTGSAALPSGAAAGGYWQSPTVLRNVTPDMAIARDEIFGPITPIISVESVDEALAISNDSRYGLSAYVFSTDYSTVLKAVDDLEFGEIYVNRTLGESVHAHHAGWKESGMGGEDGKWGMLRYTQIKTVYHSYA